MIYQQYIDAVDRRRNVGRVLVPGPASARFLHHVSPEECRLRNATDTAPTANSQHVAATHHTANTKRTLMQITFDT